MARHQFVKDDPKAVDVAASIDVAAAEFDLLGTHVGRGADEVLRPRDIRLY